LFATYSGMLDKKMLRIRLRLRIVDWKFERFYHNRPKGLTDLHIDFLRQVQNFPLVDDRLHRRARQSLAS
jgi:hypothetical protein